MEKCSRCGKPNGTGERELRPYGDNNALICFSCMTADPEVERVRNFHRLMDEADCVTGKSLQTSDGPIPFIGVGRSRRHDE
jgi:hypothetical protein